MLSFISRIWSVCSIARAEEEVLNCLFSEPNGHCQTARAETTQGSPPFPIVTLFYLLLTFTIYLEKKY